MCSHGFRFVDGIARNACVQRRFENERLRGNGLRVKRKMNLVPFAGTKAKKRNRERRNSAKLGKIHARKTRDERKSGINGLSAVALVTGIAFFEAHLLEKAFQKSEAFIGENTARDFYRALEGIAGNDINRRATTAKTGGSRKQCGKLGY